MVLFSIPVWRAGKPATADLPAGRYQLVYEVPAPLMALAVAEAEAKKGRDYYDDLGNRVSVTGYHVSAGAWWRLSGTVTLDVDVIGAPVAVVVAIVALIAVGLGVVSVFTFSSLREVRKIAETPAGQKALGNVAGGLGVAAAVVPVLVLVAAVVAAGLFAKHKGVL